VFLKNVRAADPQGFCTGLLQKMACRLSPFRRRGGFNIA